MRRLLNVALLPKAIESAEAHIAATARRTVGSFVGEGEVDLLHRWAVPIPSEAVAHVLGLPESDWPMIHRWAESQHSDANTDMRVNRRGIGAPPEEFIEYVGAQVRLRREQPAQFDDALSPTSRGPMGPGSPTRSWCTTSERCSPPGTRPPPA